MMATDGQKALNQCPAAHACIEIVGYTGYSCTYPCYAFTKVGARGKSVKPFAPVCYKAFCSLRRDLKMMKE